MTDIYEKLKEQTRNIDWAKVHVDSDRRPPLKIPFRAKSAGSGVRLGSGVRVERSK